MAVEARHLHVFPPQQILTNREMLNNNNLIEANVNNNPCYMAGFSCVMPLSGTTTATDTPFPSTTLPYNSSIVDSLPHKSESNLTSLNNNNYNLIPPSRKRSREHSSTINTNNKNHNLFSFLGHDLSHNFLQQQLDIDRLISHHMEKVREEVEERRKRQVRRVMEAIEEGVMRRLRAKEEEIEKMGKLNWALEERLKSLCVENQIWRDLAHTNEATANALRNNLQQILLAQLNDPPTRGTTTTDDAAVGPPDDAVSCCGSTTGGEREEEDDACGGGGRRLLLMCRECGKEESCVLILPCRHLCLCTLCGSTIHTCPVCKSFKNASVHINMNMDMSSSSS